MQAYISAMWAYNATMYTMFPHQAPSLLRLPGEYFIEIPGDSVSICPKT